jgi:hypothetical protein
MQPYVKILRKFRDRFLLHSSFGKFLINLYYKYSPPVADFIADRDSIKIMAQLDLFPFIGVGWFALSFDPISTMTLLFFLPVA